MNKPVTLLFLIFCIHICEINAEHSVEDWLDLASDARLFKSIKIGEYSPQKTCLPLFLPNQTFWVSYTVSIPKPDFLSDFTGDSSLYGLISSERSGSGLAINMLWLIAKIMVKYGSEMQNYDLHPQKICVSTTNYRTIDITFAGDTTFSDDLMNTADDPRCALAYSMFYFVYPMSREWIDHGNCCITGEHFCTLDFTPIKPFPDSLANNRETFYSFEACAIKLFYGEITMEDVVTYFENWEEITFLCNLWLTSIECKFYQQRCWVRETLKSQNIKKTLLDLIKKIVPHLYGRANLLYWIEKGIPVWECEEKFKEELFSREKFVDERFASAVNALCKKAGISKGKSSAPEPEIIISERTHIKLSALYKKVNEIE